MGPVPDDTRPEEVSREILFDREVLIAGLKNDERFRALLEALDEAEAEWHRRISSSWLHSGKPVDQRKVDFTRGYFAGARQYLTGRIATAETRLKSRREDDPSE